jgi:hypothetical protein
MASQFKLRTRSRLAVWTALVLTTLVVAMPGLRAEGEAYAVIVSRDVPVSNIEFDELRRIFRFKQHFWRTGQRATLLYSEENLDPGSFLLDRVYAAEYGSVRRLILEKLYSGEIDLAPKVVATDETAVAFVASGSGLIAVVRADAVGAESVKVLTVGGSALGSADYPLRR